MVRQICAKPLLIAMLVFVLPELMWAETALPIPTATPVPHAARASALRHIALPVGRPVPAMPTCFVVQTYSAITERVPLSLLLREIPAKILQIPLARLTRRVS